MTSIPDLRLMAATLRPLPKIWATQTNSLPPATSSPSLNEAINDEFFLDLLRRLLDYDRTTRLSARGVCAHAYINYYYPDANCSPLHPDNRADLPPTPVEKQ